MLKQVEMQLLGKTQWDFHKPVSLTADDAIEIK